MALICSLMDSIAASMWQGQTPTVTVFYVPPCPGMSHDCSHRGVTISLAEVKSLLWAGCVLLWCKEEMCDRSDNRGRAMKASRVQREEVKGRTVSEADIFFFFISEKTDYDQQIISKLGSGVTT